MAGRGLRSILEPVLFVGIASLLHGIVFLIPAGGPAKPDPGTTRGIRVKAYVEGPPTVPAAAVSPRAPVSALDRAAPPRGNDSSIAGNREGGQGGDEGGPSGDPGPSRGPVVGNGGPVSQSEFGQYLAHLRSDDVQGWAQKSARASRQGWKGSGAGAGGWGRGSGTGSGTGTGSGYGRAGRSGGAMPRAGYMDPRVRMVVIQYAIGEGGQTKVGEGRNIEGRLRPVPYPDLKVKQAQFTSGWWNVYIELWTTNEGRIERYNVLRPETNGPQERVFVDQVTREMRRWTFDPGRSEIHVDVRFYVE